MVLMRFSRGTVMICLLFSVYILFYFEVPHVSSSCAVLSLLWFLPHAFYSIPVFSHCSLSVHLHLCLMLPNSFCYTHPPCLCLHLGPVPMSGRKLWCFMMFTHQTSCVSGDATWHPMPNILLWQVSSGTFIFKSKDKRLVICLVIPVKNATINNY